MVRGLADLSPIASTTNLRYLHLQALKQVRSLPDMSNMRSLEQLYIETMRGLTDLGPIRDAPNLRRLYSVDIGNLEPESLRPLADPPALEVFSAGFGTDRKNNAARNDVVPSLFALPNRADDWFPPNFG
jgi:hypothetical protein